MQNPKKHKSTKYAILVVTILVILILWCKCCCDEEEHGQGYFLCATHDLKINDKKKEINHISIESKIVGELKSNSLTSLDSIFNSINKIQSDPSKPNFESVESDISEKRVDSLEATPTEAPTNVNFNDSEILDTIHISTLKIYFPYNSYQISEIDSLNLINISNLYGIYDKVQIDISSYADSRGSSSFNLRLSSRRSNTVKSILENYNSFNTQVNTFSYGESRIENGCLDDIICSEESHQENRRAELKFFVLVKSEELYPLKDFTSYHLMSKLHEINVDGHINEILKLRELNFANFIQQLSYENDITVVPNKMESVIRENIEYFNNSNSILIESPGVGLACFETNLFAQPAPGKPYVVEYNNYEKRDTHPCSKIGVYFLDSIDELVIDEIIEVANEWYWNVPDKGFYLEEAEDNLSNCIRVRTQIPSGIELFDSELGCDPKEGNLPTMTLSRIEYVFKTDSTRFRKVILHEFGHVLNRHHEFKHAEVGKIDINRFYYEVYRYRVPDTELDDLKDEFKPEGISKDIFDYNSVMNYDIPKKYVESKIDIKSSSQLSNRDSSFVLNEYFSFLNNTMKKP